MSVCTDDAPRILLTGCPVGKGSEKVLRMIEECGGIVVCQENCTGLKSFDLLVDEEDDPYAADSKALSAHALFLHDPQHRPPGSAEDVLWNSSRSRE